jgi:hypothetical protein
MLIVNNKPSSVPGMNDDPRHFNANIKDDICLSTSHATSASTLGGNFLFNHTYNQSQVLFYNQYNLSRVAQSADTYLPSHSYTRKAAQQRPKALTNPFAPATIRIPMVPGRRRWAHTFPIGKIDFNSKIF